VVTSVVAFGAFVRIADGVEGLLHISELATGDLAHPRDVLQEGQAVQARVLEIEPTQQKMKLTLRRDNQGEMSADVIVPEQAAPRRIPPPPPVDDAYWESLIQSE
jgi:small subunit ribosomal protein S1